MAESDRHVITRFAPAPTGSLHIGGARTALFNCLWARHNGGSFLLRFEDTDRERSSVQSEEAILEDLRWLGLAHDGNAGRQTSRLGRHSEILEELKSLGAVYPCFCPIASGEPQPDSHVCRTLTLKDANARIDSGEPHCWRFRVERGHGFSYSDRLRGGITFPAGSVGDFAVSRSDGSVTYLLAAAVDDHDMNISHVIRGEEHLPNVPKQEMIYISLGWTPPEWVHVPMVLGAGRRKLSKRLGAVSVGEYRARGWAPEAIVAYLATLSWSGAPADRIAPADELARLFDLDAVARFSPVHDEARMSHFGKIHLESMSDEYLLAYCEDAFASPSSPRADRTAIIREIKPQCSTCADLLACIRDELSMRDEVYGEKIPDWFAGLGKKLSGISGADWKSDNITAVMKSFAADHSLKGKEFFHPARILLTGAQRGAPIGLILSCAGKDEISERIRRI